MFALLVTLSLAMSPTLQDRTAVDPKRIESAVATLDTAFKTGKGEDRVRAIRGSMDVVDGKVIDGIGRGLRDTDESVRGAAVEALGRMRHPRALELLHTFVRGGREALTKDEVLFPAVLRAIGRHGDASSIEILADDPFSQRSHGAIQARIYGLGNIRSEKSVDALFDMLKKVGMNQADRYMDDIRLALVRLTGEDQGKAPEMWNKWWRDQKNYKLPAEPVALKEVDQKAWDSYWGIDSTREPRRADKTGKPEKTDKPEKSDKQEKP